MAIYIFRFVCCSQEKNETSLNNKKSKNMEGVIDASVQIVTLLPSFVFAVIGGVQNGLPGILLGSTIGVLMTYVGLFSGYQFCRWIKRYK